jgi:hypothetical protein
MATITKKMEEKPQESKPKFVPGKTYKWEPEDEFKQSGREFSVHYHALHTLVNNEEFQKQLQEAQKTMALFESFQILQEAFVKGVEAGVIVEVPSNEEGPVDTDPEQSL